MATYTRIFKPRARKMFKRGFDILAIPCKMNPANAWGMGVVMDKIMTPDFDEVCRAATYYNCSSAAGSYLAFYLVTDR